MRGTFDLDKAVRSNDIAAITKLNNQRQLIDIIRGIEMRLSGDRAILNSWEKHFADRNIPYAILILNGGKNAILVKERRV